MLIENPRYVAWQPAMAPGVLYVRGVLTAEHMPDGPPGASPSREILIFNLMPQFADGAIALLAAA
jgi:hypothetical protein